MTERAPDPAFEAWVEKAKAISVLTVALKYGFQPRNGGTKLGGARKETGPSPSTKRPVGCMLAPSCPMISTPIGRSPGESG